MCIGEVLVWDIGRDGDFVIATSGSGNDSHRDPVSRLQWVASHDGNNKKYNVSYSPTSFVIFIMIMIMITVSYTHLTLPTKRIV